MSSRLHPIGARARSHQLARVGVGRERNVGSRSSTGLQTRYIWDISDEKQHAQAHHGNARRAIDIHAGEEVDGSAFKALVRQALALNSSGKSKPSKTAKS